MTDILIIEKYIKLKYFIFEKSKLISNLLYKKRNIDSTIANNIIEHTKSIKAATTRLYAIL